MIARTLLEIEGDETLLTVEKLLVTQELSRHGRLEASFQSTNYGDLHHQALLGRGVKAHVVSPSNERVTIFEGVITRCRIGWAPGNAARTGSLVALTSSASLDEQRHWRTFEEQDVLDIISTVSPLVSFDSSATSRTYPQVLQHGETDFQFLLRLLDRLGWQVRTQGRDIEVAGHFGGSPALELDASKRLTSYEVETSLVTSGAEGVFHDIQGNARTQVSRPTLSPDAIGSPDGATELAARESDARGLVCGRPRMQQQHHAVQSDFEEALDSEHTRAQSRMVSGRGTSMEPGLQPGITVKIVGAGHLDGNAAITSVRHAFDTDIEAAHPGYHNEFSTSYSRVHYPQRDPAPPLEPGITTGVVRENHDPDGLGRLRVSLAWQGEERTAWVRRASLYTGPERGLFFTPEVGEEVLLAFENGDLERPIIIGALWNGAEVTHPASRSASNDVKSFVSRAGHHVEFHETGGSEKILIHTPDELCRVVLTNEGGCAIDVYTKGKIEILADEGEINVTANKSAINVTAKKGPIAVRAEDSTIDVYAKHDITVTSDANINLGAEKGTVSISAESIDIRAAKNIEVQGQTISGTLEKLAELTSGGQIKVEASSKLALTGSVVDING